MPRAAPAAALRSGANADRSCSGGLLRGGNSLEQWIVAVTVAVSSLAYLASSHAVANHVAFLVEAAGKVLRALK